MRPTRSFVVEYKRSSRKTVGPSVIRRRDIAAESLKPDVSKLATMSHLAASAVFQKVDDPRPSAELTRVARRILPVIVKERVEPPTLEPVQEAAVDPAPSPIVRSKVQRRKALPVPKPEGSEGLIVNVEVAEVTVAAQPLTPRVARKFLNSRLRGAGDNLPRGQRWKRRLPKFMR